MRNVYGSALALAALLTVPTVALAQDADRAVADGGIRVSGWMGAVDAQSMNQQSVDNARFAADGDAFHVVTGPTVTYWNPSNQATGDYTVRATFTEPEFMNLSNHPHPYGLMVAGNDLGTPQQRFLYCATYGNGSFIVRGFAPEPFRVNGQRPEANDAIHTAGGEGQSVTQEIAVTVRGNTVECSVNGTVVGSYTKSQVVGDGMLQTTDGHFGVRFGHNTEVRVSSLTKSDN